MNVTFIGMSGAGKSFVGEKYAKEYGLDFIDIDLEMEKVYKKPLRTILEELGDKKFLKEQEKQVLALGQLDNTAISPGGSVVYSDKVMDWLRDNSVIVYLKVAPEEISSRIVASDRGIVGLGDKTFFELYEERAPLYEKWSNITIDPAGKAIGDLLLEINQSTD